MYISYAKGARTWERHIDIPYTEKDEQKEVSKYCSLPNQIDQWFVAFNKAVTMCGTSDEKRRIIDEKESNYLQSLYRGLYLKRDMKKGQIIKLKDLYSAIPYQKEISQITSREYFDNEFILIKDITKDSPLTLSDIS
jgi:N-acetylneuraminate synthase